jgi:hypothetical protein
MSKQRFSSGTRFRWQDTTYQVVRLLPDGQANIESILTGVTSVVELCVLVHALFAAELYFVSKNAPTLSDAQAKSGGEIQLDLSDYPATLVSVARYRLGVISPLLELKQRTRAAVLARVQEFKNAQQGRSEHALQDSVSAAAIYRWVDSYEWVW